MSQDKSRRRVQRRWMPTAPGILVRCAVAIAIALLGATAVVAQAGAAPHDAQHHVAPSVHHQDAPGFPGTSTTAPFNECPAVGADTSCAILIDVTPSGTKFLGDPSQGPYDSADDTLVGIVNQSGNPLIYGVTITSPLSTPVFGFDGDGICTYATGGTTGGGFTGDGYCSPAQLSGTDPADYQGPINAFGAINSTQTTGTVIFPSPGLAPGASTYFSLENTPLASQLSGGGTLTTPPGYDLAGSDGGVFVFPVGSSSGFFGSLPALGVHVNNVVGMVPTNNFMGYDLVGSDGGVFVFPVGLISGFYGSLPLIKVTVNNVVGIVPTNMDTGYDLVGSDGGVFVFPTGQLSGFFGSLPGLGVHVNNIVGIVASPDGGGYFLVGKDGGVFPFGDAPFLGSLPSLGISVNNIVGIASTPDGQGYWVVGSDGSVYAFGDAVSYGSLPALGVTVSNIVSIVPTPDAGGYWLIGTDGGVFSFGDANSLGSLPGLGVHVNNIVGAVPTL